MRPVWDGCNDGFGEFFDRTISRAFRLSLLLTRDRAAATDLTYRAYLCFAGCTGAVVTQRDEVGLLAVVTSLSRTGAGPRSA